MLVLTRKVDEEVDIWDTSTDPPTKVATIKPIEIRGNTVRLGFEGEQRWQFRRSEKGPPEARATHGNQSNAPDPGRSAQG